MKVEFPQGVPAGCTQWLRENVGLGNIEEEATGRTQQWMNDIPEYAWFYKRIEKPTPPGSMYDDPFYYVPTITVKDPKLAVLFALKWSK